jgi:hypothetical protein
MCEKGYVCNGMVCIFLIGEKIKRERAFKRDREFLAGPTNSYVLVN